jgi:hypothetical protein
MAAFLAHYRVLQTAANSSDGSHLLSGDERATLTAMEALTEALTPQERAALGLDGEHPKHASGEALRRCERAESKLRRIVLEKGILQS